MASIYLFGYLEDDYLGRVMVASEELTIGELAEQLSAWSYERGAARCRHQRSGRRTGPASTDTCCWARQR